MTISKLLTRILVCLALPIVFLGATTLPLQISSSAFVTNGAIPTRHTCDGQNLSPALAWTGVPEKTQSFVLAVDDPDAPGGTHHHWAIYNIPANATHLDEAFSPPTDAEIYAQAKNDSGKIGYGGPCPPPGRGMHHYHFKLMALDVEKLSFPDRPQSADVEEQAQKHIISTAETIGTYERK